MTRPVVREAVFFDSGGDRLAGHLFRPLDADASPAVVVTGSWLTVKEQMAGHYARLLAGAGFVALAFDFTGFGESEGTPRDVESPSRKSQDIHHAVSFLAGHNAVDPDRIGAVAICASSGYTADNAASDPRVRALALVAPWLLDTELATATYGGEAGVAQRIDAGQQAQAHYDKTGEVRYVAAASATDPTAAMYGPFDYYLDPGRGRIPQWSNRFAVMAWPEWLTYSPIPTAARTTVPTLLVHSEQAAIPEGARRFHAGLHRPGELVWLTGDQFDFYDHRPTIDQAMSHVTRHLTTTLGRP